MTSITCIETGKVDIKRTQVFTRRNRSAIGRKWDMIRDKTWFRELPILTFLIRHESGALYLVDTGDCHQASHRDHVPWWHFFMRSQVRVRLAPHEEIGPRLLRLGIEPNDLKGVIITHLHADHAGGLKHFPRVPIYVSLENYRAAKGFRGTVSGNLSRDWPTWFEPRFIDFADGPIGPFLSSMQLESDKSIVIVPTPGHAPGHISVIVTNRDGLKHFITGDAAYMQETVSTCTSDGVTMDPKLQEQSLRKIHEYSKMQPTVILCSHDPRTVERLEKGQCI